MAFALKPKRTMKTVVENLLWKIEIFLNPKAGFITKTLERFFTGVWYTFTVNWYRIFHHLGLEVVIEVGEGSLDLWSLQKDWSHKCRASATLRNGPWNFWNQLSVESIRKDQWVRYPIHSAQVIIFFITSLYNMGTLGVSPLILHVFLLPGHIQLRLHRLSL